MFPAISAATITALTSYNGGNISVSWTIPTGTKSQYLEVTLDNSSSSNSIQYDLDATTTNYLATLEAKTASGQAFTPSERNIHLAVTDNFGRELLTSIWK